VVKNNLDPVWEEEFLWESVGREDFLEIAIWSRGALQDSFLGKVEIRIADATTTEGTHSVGHFEWTGRYIQVCPRR